MNTSRRESESERDRTANVDVCDHTPLFHQQCTCNCYCLQIVMRGLYQLQPRVRAFERTMRCSCYLFRWYELSIACYHERIHGSYLSRSIVRTVLQHNTTRWYGWKSVFVDCSGSVMASNGDTGTMCLYVYSSLTQSQNMDSVKTNKQTNKRRHHEADN